MQDIEPVCFVVFIDRGHDGIDDGFDGAVGDRVDKRCQIQHPKIFGEDREDRGDQVADKGEGDRDAVADAIDDQAEEDDRDRKREQADAAEDAFFSSAKRNCSPISLMTPPRTAKPNAVAVIAMKQPRNNRRAA